MTLPDDITEYFARLDARRILVLEIRRNDEDNTTYYLADTPYYTEPSDLPPNMPFTPVISKNGMPAMERLFSDPFSGQVSTSFGDVTLTFNEWAWTSYIQTLDLGDGAVLETDDGEILWVSGGGTGQGLPTVRRGARVTAKIAAPREFYPYASAKLLFMGQVSSVPSGSSAGDITLTITDRTDEFTKALLVVSDAPITVGFVRNMEPYPIDLTAGIYQVHAGAIAGITAVYDQGAVYATNQYEVDIATGKLTMLVTPVGTLTCDVMGAVDADGNWLSNTDEIIPYLIDLAGIDFVQQYTDVDQGTIGYVIRETTELGDVVFALLQGCGCSGYVDRDGVFKAAPYPVPNAVVPTSIFGQDKPLTEVTTVGEQRVYKEIRYQYRYNWTKYQSRSGATNDMASYTQREGVVGSVMLAAPDQEIVYTPAPIMVTFFDDEAPAQAAARRIMRIFGVPRRYATAEVPYSEVRALREEIVVYFGNQQLRGPIVGITDTFDSAFPRQKLTIITSA